MEIIEEENIYKIKNEWENLIDSKQGRIYYSFPFHKNIYDCWKANPLVFSVYRLRLKYFCVKNENKTVSIFPALFKEKTKEISFAGELGAAGYNDIIGGTKEDVLALIEYIKNNYKKYKIKLKDIDKDSILNEVFSTTVERECFFIPVNQGFDCWLNSLSHNTRGNIRRVYKRIERNNFEIKYKIASELKPKEINRIFNLYYRHLKEILLKTGKKFSIFENVVSLMRGYLPLYRTSPVFSGINSTERCKVAYATHNDKIVAFQLLYEEPDRVLGSKCAYDTAYFKYRVGSYTLLETIRFYSERTGIIDLSRGYHDYKVWYGGQPYLNYHLEI